MTIIKCSFCGKILNVRENESVVKCNYCARTVIVPTANRDRKINGTITHAQILLHGDCNYNCIGCIGKSAMYKNLPSNINKYPLPGFTNFMEMVNRIGIKNIAVSGIYAEPLIYDKIDELVDDIRKEAQQDVIITLHTNGSRALSRIKTINKFDKVTYNPVSMGKSRKRTITGNSYEIPWNRIVEETEIPAKVAFTTIRSIRGREKIELEMAKSVGFKRAVIRLAYGEEIKSLYNLLSLKPIGRVNGNVVTEYKGMEVTIWDYTMSTINCLYLFPDGVIRDNFILNELNTNPYTENDKQDEKKKKIRDTFNELNAIIFGTDYSGTSSGTNYYTTNRYDRND